MMGKRLYATVRGLVQGVGFRYYVVRVAQEFRLSGTVANMPDGSVRVVAEGPEERLRKLAGRLREGPSASVVKDVELEWSDATGEFRGFDVTFPGRD